MGHVLALGAHVWAPGAHVRVMEVGEQEMGAAPSPCEGKEQEGPRTAGAASQQVWTAGLSSALGPSWPAVLWEWNTQI